jgi:hypothetical protein
MKRYDERLGHIPQQIDLSVQGYHQSVDTFPLEYRVKLRVVHRRLTDREAATAAT